MTEQQPPPTMTDLMVAPESFDVCGECGEIVATGDWPFCPHGRGGAYGFKMGMSMRTNGWNRSKR